MEPEKEKIRREPKKKKEPGSSMPSAESVESEISSTSNAAEASRLQLSPTVEGALKRFPRDEPISAVGFTRAILEPNHIKEYAGGMFISLTLRETKIKRPAQEWLDEIVTLFDASRILELEKTSRALVLHGRLVIAGLCLLDQQLRKQLDEAKVFEKLISEIKEPFDKILSERGSDLYYYELPASVSTWGDDPVKETADDRLGRVPFARYLARRLSAVSMEEGAYVMHLYAPWGSGKSTLLSFLRDVLEKGDGEGEDKVSKQQWLVVDFNAWLHQNIRPPWWSLMDSIYRKTKKKLTLWNRFLEWSWRFYFWYLLLILAVVAMAWIIVLTLPWLLQGIIAPLEEENLPLYDQLIKLGTLAKNLGEILAFIVTVWGGILAINRSLLLGAAKAAQEYKDRVIDPMNDIKKRFRTLINRLKPFRVVVIIDDLDRCRSNYVVDLLEGIQTLFREMPVIFVVAADRVWLNACYEQVYEKIKPQISKPGKSLGDLFLEKAFRFSTPLPGIPKELKQQYWDYLLQLKPSQQKAEWENARQKAKSLLSEAKSEGEINRKVDDSRSQSFPEQRAIREAAVEQLALPKVQERIEHSLQKYINLLEPNPRAMKRLANAYSANLALKYLSEVEVERHQLVLWTILSSRWPHVADRFLESPEVVDDFVGGKFINLSDDWKKLVGDDNDEIEEVVIGLADAAPLSSETIKNCRLMQA
jgi:hypothetical protein